MNELSEYGIDEPTLKRMYAEWQAGVPKSTLETQYLGKTSSHGKVFTGLVRKYLGIETERRSGLAEENQRLRALLIEHGIDPDTGRLRNPVESSTVGRPPQLPTQSREAGREQSKND